MQWSGTDRKTPPTKAAPSVSARAEEVNALHAQLDYYRKRVVDFESERGSLLDSVEKCSVQAGELHRLDWENRRRADEIRELQKALSDAHVFLFEERQRLLSLQAENDELRLQEIEDRKRIQQLLEYDPVLAARSGAANPQASVEALMLKLESLQAQMEEGRQLSSERITALLEDRRIREGEEAAHREAMNAQLEAQAAKLKRTEELLREATKDAILARREAQGAEEHAHAATAAGASERSALQQELAVLKRKAEHDAARMKQQSEHKLDDVATNLRRQLKSKEDELLSLGSVHTATKAALEKRVVELEGRSAKLSEHNKGLETRRHMDMEGFTADLTNLRKMLASIERKLHEMRLVERLGDDDRLDSILAHLRHKAPPMAGESDTAAGGQRDARGGRAVEPSEASYSVKSELAQELRAVKGRIKGLEDRLASKKKALAQGTGLSPPGPAVRR
ncbi:hypothetical protein FOA52_011101 [Chlamydomonas sp. UWO 241]|nr:hypothetical protein FOA52_011101 [Chlamydomonas sp. UWO 241]